MYTLHYSLPKPKVLIHNTCSNSGKKPIAQTRSSSSLKNPQEQKPRSNYFHELIFKPLDDLIHRLSNHSSLPPFINPKHVLSASNFSPVGELPPTPCHMALGPLPLCLDGAYIQNGPNPQFPPRGPYHIADGDGMLHSLKISDGQATFCSRFVQTHKYTVERDLGYPIFPNPIAYFLLDNPTALMALTAARILTGQINPFAHGFGPANTSLLLFTGKLFALVESDLPYEIRITDTGDVVTIGRHDFGSRKLFLNMTAHPKIDKDTGEAFAFGYNVNVFPPCLAFFRIGSDGTKHEDVPIYSINKDSMVASYIHDFAVTENYAVFPDRQVVVGLGRRRMMRVDCDKVPRLGVIGRYDVDESGMCWIEVPGLNMLHVFNAWEEDDVVVMVASNALSVENLVGETGLTRLSLEKITIDVKGKKVSRSVLSPRNLEFATINPGYAGKKNRYMYAAAIEGYPKMAGVVKLDLSLFSNDGDCTVVGSRIFGPGCYCSEPIFMAKEPENQTTDEDDGYLLCYVNNENTNESEFIVMDAKSPDLETVAVVKLPRKVPQGFHSIFVRECDLP